MAIEKSATSRSTPSSSSRSTSSSSSRSTSSPTTSTRSNTTTESTGVRSSSDSDDRAGGSALLDPEDSVSLSSGGDDINLDAMRDLSRSLRANASSESSKEIELESSTLLGNDRESSTSPSSSAQGHRLSLGWDDDEVIEHTTQEGRVSVAQIDDFASNPDLNSSVSHGEQVGDVLTSEGVDVVPFHIGRDATVSDNLERVIDLIEKGADFDAVNLSLSTSAPTDKASAETYRRMDQAITTLQEEYDVPVVVASGNDVTDEVGDGSGLGQRDNMLGYPSALEVGNAWKPAVDWAANGAPRGPGGAPIIPGSPDSDFGEVASPFSSPGNILAEGFTTSLATPVVAANAAKLREQGYAVPEVVEMLQQRALAEGGALDRSF